VMRVSDDPKGVRGGHVVEALVDMVQRTYTDDLSAREQLGVVRLEQTWQRQRASRMHPVMLGLRAMTAVLALAALIPAGILLYARYAGLTYRVVGGTVGAEGTIQPDAGSGTMILFSEGSRIGFDGPARARVASMTAEGGQVVLEDGGATVEIVHRPRAQWLVL